MSFVHLHVHSEYSFLDSLLKVEEIVKFASEHSKIACISDHGHITAFVELAKACKKYGCKPIYASEIYECDDEFSIDAEGKRLPHYHFI